MKPVNTSLAMLAIVALASCASQPSEKEMNYLGSALTKVSAAVDATARFKRSADAVEGAELLQMSTSHDPSLMKPFAGYRVRVLRQGKDTAVLVCQPGDGPALLEDAGCTARLDAHRWTTTGGSACEFTVDLKQICVR